MGINTNANTNATVKISNPVINPPDGLLDTRYCYFSVTVKGYVFLHLLKESLTITITKMHQEVMFE